MKGVPVTDEQIEEILLRYIQGMSVLEISKETDIPARTIYNNLKRPEVVKRLQEEATYVKNQTRTMIMRNASNYIKNIQEIADKTTDVRSKLKANETLLAYIIGQPTAKIETSIEDNTNTDKNLLEKLYGECDLEDSEDRENQEE